MTMIVFRMDDITPDMNWEAFYNYIDLFNAFKIYPLLGIVPDNKTQYFLLKACKGIFR